MGQMESLPQRVFLDAALVGNVLTVTPVAGHVGERFGVFMLSANRVGVYIKMHDVTQPELLSAGFDLASIASVDLTASDGEGTTRISVDLPTTVNGGAGEDSIIVTGGPATVNGNAGGDVIFGGPFADSINGGLGPD